MNNNLAREEMRTQKLHNVNPLRSPRAQR